MKKFLLVICTTAFLASSNAQKGITTGSQSPIIRGANSKIKYVNEQRIKLDIPTELTPYLAGLLMSNNISSKTTVDNALIIWTKKFNELKKAIKASDATTASKAMPELEKGNFTEVERLLNSKSNYSSLIKIFPNTYITSGDQSPVIIGDYGNVTYTVTQIINYNLPEGVTVHLLSELKSKDNYLKKQNVQIKNLAENLESKAELAKKWITQYKMLEKQLKNSPDALGKKAYAYFEKGDLKGALKVLDQASGDDITMAKNRLLKAKILLLRINYDSLDTHLKTIRTYYATSVPFLNNYESQMDYSKFLIDYLADYVNAIPILTEASTNAKSVDEQTEVLNYLSLALSPINKNKSIENLEKALQILNENEPLVDSTLIERKSLIQYNLAVTYTAGTFDSSLIRKSIQLIDDAIITIDKFNGDKLLKQYRTTAFQAMKGRYFYMLGDTLSARTEYYRAMEFLENSLQRNQLFLIPLSGIYMAVGELYNTRGLQQDALAYYHKARSLIEPKVSLSSNVYFVVITQIYTAILRTYQFQGQVDSLYKYLSQIEGMVEPFVKKNKDSYSFFQSSIYTDLGNFHLLTGKPEKAKDYLKKAYSYFINHLSEVSQDKMKFHTCIASLNQALIATIDFETALNYNYLLIDKLNSLATTNPLAFEDFIPQVYSQLSDVHFYKQKKDSSLFYATKAMQLSSKKALQYPLLYNVQYFDLSFKTISLLIRLDEKQTADNIAMEYISSWEKVYEVSELARNLLKGFVAATISRIGFLYQQAAINSMSVNNKQELLIAASKYYNIAEVHFNNISEKNDQDKFQFATYLLTRSTFEKLVNSNNISQKQHELSQCKYARQAKELFEKLTWMPNCKLLLNQSNVLLGECN